MKRRSEKLYRRLAHSATIDIALMHGTGPFITYAYWANDQRFTLMSGKPYTGSVFYITNENGNMVWAIRYPEDTRHGFKWSIEQLEDFIFTHWKRRLKIGEP